MDGQTDGLMHGQTNRWMDGWTGGCDGWMDGCDGLIDGWMNR